jgi:formylglycine-generating enzyme required for sulfatase activity
MTPEPGNKVFISYSSPRDAEGEEADSIASDQRVADQICRRLESEGIRCWIAPRDILPGDSWLDSMIDAVKQCQIFILVFSANTYRSQWVKDEITLALNRNIKIIPFRIENISPQGTLEILQARCHWIDAHTPPLEKHLDRLTQAVRTHLDRAGKKQSHPEETQTKKSPSAEKAEPAKKENQRGIPPDLKAVEAKADVKVIKNINGEDLYEADFGSGIIMVYIPPGKFTMGSNDYDNEKPPHDVYLDGCWLGKTEVTFDQYDRFCEETNRNKPSDEGWGRGKRPVINVSWDDANEYCKWLSRKKGLAFKLPSEAQWEKAARGSDGRQYPWGNHDPYYNGKYYANYWSDKDGFEYTAPVGSYPHGASPYGLLDMAGNVWEWCMDWYDGKYYKNSPPRNPTGPSKGSYRVVRGGGWLDFAVFIRCAGRYYGTPSLRGLDLGVRLCQEVR